MVQIQTQSFVFLFFFFICKQKDHDNNRDNEEEAKWEAGGRWPITGHFIVSDLELHILWAQSLMLNTMIWDIHVLIFKRKKKTKLKKKTCYIV